MGGVVLLASCGSRLEDAVKLPPVGKKIPFLMMGNILLKMSLVLSFKIPALETKEETFRFFF